MIARTAALAAGAALGGMRPGGPGRASAVDLPPVDAHVVRDLVDVGRAGPFAILEPDRAREAPFTAVGVRAPSGAQLHVRSRDRGGRWSPWQPVPVVVDEGPDATSAEGRRGVAAPRAPVWVGPARRGLVALDGAAPDDVDVTLVDSLGLGAGLAGSLLDGLLGDDGPGSVERPAIRGRREWGAQPPRDPPGYADGVDFAVLHHTVTANGYPRDHTWAIARAIQHHHQHVNGWSDVGYNFMVDRFGRILQARHGGVGQPVIGAHAGGFNTGSVGIAVIGDHRSAPISDAAYRALVVLLAWLCDRHGIDPHGQTSRTSGGSTRYPRGRRVTLPTICGHRHVSHTGCPGDPLLDRLGALRNDVAVRTGGAAVGRDGLLDGLLGG